jgi:hypothetical protein
LEGSCNIIFFSSDRKLVELEVLNAKIFIESWFGIKTLNKTNGNWESIYPSGLLMVL